MGAVLGLLLAYEFDAKDSIFIPVPKTRQKEKKKHTRRDNSHILIEIKAIILTRYSNELRHFAPLTPEYLLSSRVKNNLY